MKFIQDEKKETLEDSDERLEKLSDILSVFPKLQGLIMDVLEEKNDD